MATATGPDRTDFVSLKIWPRPLSDSGCAFHNSTGKLNRCIDRYMTGVSDGHKERPQATKVGPQETKATLTIEPRKANETKEQAHAFKDG